MTAPGIRSMANLHKTIVLMLLLAAALPARASDTKLLDAPLPNGGHQRVLFLLPPDPKAVIIMLPGGSGDVGLTRDGEIQHDNNFLVRTRELWTARSYAVLIPDTIDQENLRGLRSSPEYARVVDSLIGFAHRETPAPIFLLGTSQGSIAAMNGAAHAGAGSIAGVILTESVSVMGGSRETVFDANPQAVRAPALVVANLDDRCDVAPPAMAPKIAAAMTNSPDVKVKTVSGGISRSSRECSSLTPHGYYGIEEQVVDLISGWMLGHLR
jgi:hypothetical protein